MEATGVLSIVTCIRLLGGGKLVSSPCLVKGCSLPAPRAVWQSLASILKKSSAAEMKE